MLIIIVFVLLLMVLAGVYIRWYLNGYSEDRVLKKKQNRLTAVGAGRQVLYFVDGNNRSLPGLEWIIKTFPALSFLASYVPLPEPYVKVFFTLVYTQIVSKDAKDPEVNKYGKPIRYGQSHPVIISQGEVRIREVTEEVYNFRHTEIHPFFFAITFPCGLTFFLLLDSRIEIDGVDGAMKALKLENPLRYAQKELQDPLGNWAVRQQDTWVEEAIRNKKLKKKDANDYGAIGKVVIENMLKINIDDPSSIIIKSFDGSEKILSEYINAKLSEYGMRIKSFSMIVGYSEEVNKIIKNRAKLTDKDTEIALEKKNNQLRQARIVQEIGEWKDIKKEKVDKLSEILVSSRKAYGEGGLKFFGSSEKSEDTVLMASILEELKPEKQKNGNEQQ